MKKYWIFFLFLFFLSSQIFAEALPAFPKEFEVKQKNSGQATFYFGIKEHTFGKVIKREEDQKVFYEYFDNENQLIATAIATFSATQANIELYNHNDHFIGKIKYSVFPLLPSKYELFNSHHQLTAVSNMNWLGSRFSLIDPHNSHTEFAAFTRPYFNLFNDNWHVKLNPHKPFDYRFIMIVAAFQTDLSTKNNEFGR